MKTSVLITNIPTPYRLPFWEELKKSLPVQVICIAKTEKNRLWEIEDHDHIHFLKSYHLFFSKKDWALHFTLPLSLFFLLVEKKPDIIIITGYDSFQYWEALFYAKFFKKKKVMWSGSTLLSSRSNNTIINTLKKYFINSFDSFYSYGSKASEYLEYFGVDKRVIVTGINTIDTNFYKNNTSNASINNRHINFLYIGQLIERKGLKSTILAFSKLRKKNWSLVIVGSGADELELKKLVTESSLEQHINFVGYKQKSEIIPYLSTADVFLMPSYIEVWGLVLNEALASGLFCLSSKYAGATFDLIEKGKNGFIIDPEDTCDFLSKIRKTFDIKFDKLAIKNSFNVSYKEEARKLMLAVSKAVK